jgi:hypothetical protein
VYSPNWNKARLFLIKIWYNPYPHSSLSKVKLKAFTLKQIKS